MVKFLRRNWNRHSKFSRKSKLTWRRPTGRDNKMREKRRGYAPSVSIGYRNTENKRGKLDNKKPVLIMNIKDLAKLGKGSIGIIGKIGAKNKIEIVKKAKDLNKEIWNINVNKFIKNIGRVKK